MSSTGPKVLDVNARMGGFYIPVWIEALTGLDTPAAAFAIACDIRPVGRVVREPRGAIAGVQLYPGDGHDRAQVTAADPLIVAYASAGGPHEVGEYPESVGNVAFRGATPDEALAALRAQLPALYAKHPERGAALVALLDRMP